MTDEVRELVVPKVREMLAAASCCAEAITAGEAWLAALGTDGEQAATKALLEELEQDITPIDDFVAFAGSEVAQQMLGQEFAQKMQAHALELKASGAAFCDCPACSAAAAILEHKSALLA